MNKKLKRCLALGLSILMLFSMTGCRTDETDSKGEDKTVIHIAYQYGLAYSPTIIAQHNKMIEEEYKQACGKEVEVVWTQMSSGADINVAIASGNADIGFMGIAPAISGIMNQVGYKIFTNVSGQEHAVMTNDGDVKELGDLIGTDKQVALVNIGSIQHIILAKALKNAGYDAHALDANIAAMKHPDGMSAVQSGSIACHLTTNPYVYVEREDESLHEVEGISDVWTKENTFVVGVASKELYENQEVYEAVCRAFSDAIQLINEDEEAAAKITCAYNGNSFEKEVEYMKAGSYSEETVGIYELAQFMAEEGFLETAPKDYETLVYENVKGN